MKTFILFFLLCSLSLLGQETPKDTLLNTQESLPEVLIKSTPIADKLQRVPASVNIVSARDLERGDQTTISNELNKLPGVFMQQGALNTSRITIRGIGARSPYGTNRVKAYFEGIPITTGEGGTTLDDIDLNLIDGIEIIKGPASSSYGSGLGGVIHISAKKPVKNSVQASAMGGSYGLFKYGGTASIASERAGVAVGYYDLREDGFRENSSYRRQNLSLYATTDLSAEHKLSLFMNLTRLKAFIPSSLSYEDFNNNPKNAAFTWGQAKGYESYDKANVGFSHTWTPNEHWQWTTSIFMNYRDGYEPRPFNILDEKSTAAGIRSSLKNSFNLFGVPTKSSIGVEYFDERYNVKTDENLYEQNNGNGTLQGDRLSNVDQDRKYLDLFARISLQITDALKAEAGLSYNHSRYILEDLYNANPDDRNVYTYPRQFLPHVGLTYEVIKDQFVYATVDRGFSLPSVEETLTPEGTINPNLKPENGTSYELGLKSKLLDSRLYLELAFYTMRIKNLIVARRTSEDQYIGINAGKTDHSGIELLLNFNQNLYAQWRLNPYVSLALNKYRFDEFVDNGADYGGNDLTGVPDSVINGGITLSQEQGWTFNINYRYVGDIPLNDVNTVYSSSYNLVNLRIDHAFVLSQKIPLTIYGGVNNVFDTAYASQILPNASSFDGTAPRYYYPGEPVNFYVGINVRPF